MSIIQEALRKAQVEPQRREALPLRIAPKTRESNVVPSKKRIVPNPLLVIALIVESGLAAKQYLWDAESRRMTLPRIRAAAKAGVSGKNDQKSLVKTESSVAEAYREPTLDIARIQIARPEMPMFDLNGIMYLENMPKAIINNVVVEEGDVINGALVAKINSQKVLLKFDDSEITLKLK